MRMYFRFIIMVAVLVFLYNPIHGQGKLPNYFAEIKRYAKTDTIIAYRYLDSLTTIYRKIKKDTLLFSIQNFRGLIYEYNNELLKAKQAYHTTLTLLKRKNMHTIHGVNALLSISNVYEKESKFDSTIYFCKLAVAEANRTTNSNAICKTNLKLAEKTYWHISPNKALPLYYTTLNTAKKLNNFTYQCYALLGIGYDFRSNNQLEKAKELYLEALTLSEQKNLPVLSSFALSHLSKLHAELLNDKKTALEYIQRKKAIVEKLNNDQEWFDYYFDLAYFNNASRKFNDALPLYKKALYYAKKNRNQKNMSTIYYNLGFTYHNLLNKKLALIYHDSSLVIKEKNNDVVGMWYSYYEIAYLYRDCGEYKNAFDYYEKYAQINDTVLTKDHNSKMTEMQTQYEVEKKNDENKYLKAQNEKKLIELKTKEQRNFYLSITIAAIALLSIVAIAAYFLKRRDNLVLHKQKQEIIAKTDMVAEQAAKIARLQTQMNPHFVFNALNAIQQFILEKKMDQTLTYLNDFSKLMRMTLNNSDKEFIALTDEINFLNLYMRFEKLRFDNKFSFTLECELEHEHLKVPPMLIQPFIENAIIHGLANKPDKGDIMVTVKQVTLATTACLEICIADNGIGRVAAALKKKNQTLVAHESKGINITVERIKSVQLKNNLHPTEPVAVTDFYVDNVTTGTTVRFWLPLIEEF